VAGNASGVGGTEDLSGTITTNGPNLIGVSPLLAPLGNYGGRTQTMPPLPGSPAIDGAINGSPHAVDQRGFPRVVGAFPDLGAAESGNAIPTVDYTVVTTTADFLSEYDDNGVSLRSAVAFATNGSTITFSNTLSGDTIVLTNGQIALAKGLAIDASSLPDGISVSGNNSSRVFEVLPVAVSLTGLTIRDGDAPAPGGGGILNNGVVTVTNCTFAFNTAVDGGGFNNSGAMATIVACTFSTNTATSDGGGLRSSGSGAVVTILQSTFTGNSVDSPTGGGAINASLNASSSMFLNGCTIAGNSATGASAEGGGILRSGAGGTFTITNCIVAGNFATVPGTENLSGSITTNGPNLIGGSPLLAPLGDYGGPTQAMPPLPGSPAIDGATNGSSFAVDQRGFPRVVGAYPDLGAVEGVYNPVGPTLTDVLKLGDGSVQFGFTNYSGMIYSVLATTNVVAPLNTWANLGPAVEAPPGMFQFTDTEATNYPLRFYRVQGP